MPKWGVFSHVQFLVCHLLTQSLYVEGYGEESKVHCCLVFAEVPEPAVCHVELHLAKYSFGLDASPASEPEPFFRCEQLPGFPLVFVETMVYLDDPSVASSLVAQASQRAEEKENVETRHIPQLLPSQ